jgi:formate-dependent nitrite reductase cytochrome c552 subunit
VVWDCTQCHKMQLPKPEGPHGMHLVGQDWVRAHGLQVDESGAAACIGCHGSDGHGTVLSQTFADRSFNTKFGNKKFAKGTAIGCYSCHSENRTP